jgi:hypothetical protein
MADAKAKGKTYRALTNVSLGKNGGQIMAGQTFQLDDKDVAEHLISKGAISENLKPAANEALNVPSNTSSGEPPNAAMTRGQNADVVDAGGDPSKVDHPNTGSPQEKADTTKAAQTGGKAPQGGR